MATIVSRKGPGRTRSWQVKIRRRGYPPQSTTFDTHADADAWARQIENEMDRGVFVSRVEADSTTLADLLDRYRHEITPQKRGAENEGSHIRIIGQDPIARCFISTLTGKVLAGYRDRRLKSVSASTVNRELNILSHVLSIAAKEWHFHLPWGNPVSLLRRPKSADKRERRLLDGEDALLLASAETDQGESIGAIIRLALETGMRRGEIAEMRWEHLDRKSRSLLIPETKSGTPRRVPLSSRALAVFGLDGQVFDVHPASISRAFERTVGRARKAYLAECGTRAITPDSRMLSDLRFHDLRHEATSRLFEKGLNPMEVAAITGHKTLQMLKRYTHLRAEDLVGRLG